MVSVLLQLNPLWYYMDYFVYANQQTVMIYDATNLTRPMTRYVESPAEISANFDTIAYQKGLYAFWALWVIRVWIIRQTYY